MALQKDGGGFVGDVGEPTGRKRMLEKWRSPMALPKFGRHVGRGGDRGADGIDEVGEAGLMSLRNFGNRVRGGVGEPIGRKRPSKNGTV